MQLRRTVVLTVIVATLMACGPTVVSSESPTPAGSVAPSASFADPELVYAAIRAEVEAIRGLRPTNDIAPTIIGADQLAKNLTADFDEENPAAAVEVSQRTLIALGLLPAGASLRSLVLALQSGQVAGYYSPKQKQLFVVSRSGGVGPTQRVTYAHEFTHELQDQHFDLQSLGLDATDQGDRSLARLALVEGDAVSAQTTWMQTELSTADLLQVAADAADPAAMAALTNAPPYLRATSFFPYTDGLAFVQTLLERGGYAAVNAAFARPPDSTEQILHPEKYLSNEKPIAVALPSDLATRLGSGWTAAGQDTLGELSLRTWLTQGKVAAATATTAAAGWGGDRLELLEGPAGDAVAIETVWDTTTDATEFAAAAAIALVGLGLSGQVVHSTGSSRVSLAIGAGAGLLAAQLPG